MSSLTFEQAKAIWKARWLDTKVRDLCATYDVDPRRLYEIWQEDVHRGSRQAAFEEMKAELPAITPKVVPPAHEPRFSVIPKPVQGDLFDFITGSS